MVEPHWVAFGRTRGYELTAVMPESLVSHVENVLRASLAPTHLEVLDDSAQHAGHAGNHGGGHVQVVVVSAAFEGKSLVARHRMVNALFAEDLRQRIHALALSTLTPEEWSRRR